MAGLVLAVGVTTATLLGWLGPARANEAALPAPAAEMAPTTPQVVLVPVAPSIPSVATGLSTAPAQAPAARPLAPALQDASGEHRELVGLRADADHFPPAVASLARRHENDD
jgi:hypothetical protein